MSQIRYYIPEDGDNENHPNVFLLPSSTKSLSTGEGSGSGMSPKLGDIRSAFPVPGNYHFRFKCPLVPGTDREKNTISVWMDCYDDNSHVGVWKNTVFAKVTRIHGDDATGAGYATGYTSNGSTTRSVGVTHSSSPIVNNPSVTQSASSAPSSRPPQINNQVPSSETLIDVPSTTSTTTTHNPSQHNYPATTVTNRRPHPVAVEAETLIDVYADEPQQPVRSITLPTPNNATSQPHSSERSRSRSTPLPLQQMPNSNNNGTINNRTHANDTEEGIQVGFNTSEGNLLDVDNHHPNPHVTTSISSNSSLLDMNAAPTSSSGLIDMNAAPYSSTSTASLTASGLSSSAHDDFLGMCASPTATATANTPAASTVSTVKAVVATPPVVVKSQPLINTNVFSKPGGRNGGDDFGGLNW